MGEREKSQQGETTLTTPGSGQPRSHQRRRARSLRAVSSCRGGRAGLSAALVKLAGAERHGKNVPKGTSSHVPDMCKAPSTA